MQAGPFARSLLMGFILIFLVRTGILDACAQIPTPGNNEDAPLTPDSCTLFCRLGL
jgi:hypothetical protein